MKELEEVQVEHEGSEGNLDAHNLVKVVLSLDVGRHIYVVAKSPGIYLYSNFCFR